MRGLSQRENVSKPFEGQQYLAIVPKSSLSPHVENSFPTGMLLPCDLDNGSFCLSDVPQELNSKGMLIKYLEIPKS